MHLKKQKIKIYFPKSLEEGWCSDTENLNKIIISPLNDQFIFKDNKYLLGKSVSKICEGAFSDCKNLQIIDISEESKL